ncbi:uncharacterized protein LOC119677203 [Teleopsis dalmanni]|uniref:uncharacterized protein LOC119677203 n=1 Tax=Teleopsis dalmanni TaxID=139649 RepID=UPI0018CE13B4|nr:uncharacterized protein LOC119677203 [Teleopsis dalmanni]
MPFPMPIMEEQQLAGNCYFITLDLRMGYHQIEMDEDSKKYTAFVTTDGHYEFNRMSFGLVNAPAMFQSVMNRVIAKMSPGEIMVYLDDVIISSTTIEEGLKRLSKFLNILRGYKLTLRLAKCQFLATQVLHLGHIIGKNDWLYTMQIQDENLREIISILKGDVKSPNDDILRKEYCLQKHRLYRREADGLKFVVPKYVRWRVVQLCHDRMGHFALEKTIERIRQNFWFAKIRKAVRDTKTAHVINAINDLTTYFGLPSKIVTDRGTAFTSKVFESYCNDNGIHHIKTAVRTPRANGPNELIFDFDLRNIVHNELIAAVNDDTHDNVNQTTMAEKRILTAENIARERQVENTI